MGLNPAYLMAVGPAIVPLLSATTLSTPAPRAIKPVRAWSCA
jgi:hypothetical protein